jgi:hypothetical protein
LEIQGSLKKPFQLLLELSIFVLYVELQEEI